jgi:putative hydrolase of the HAD superfamily
LDYEEVEKRHQTNVAIYEEGKLGIDEYLRRVVFFEDRAFSQAEFQQFMFDQSAPYLEMIAFVKQLKAEYGLKIVVLSNEARETNAHRIAKFGLNTFVDAFISSCLVHLRKPDEAIFRLAIDVVVTPPQQIVYIENTPLFVEIMAALGVRSILHRDWESTAAALACMGLPL